MLKTLHRHPGINFYDQDLLFISLHENDENQQRF